MAMQERLRRDGLVLHSSHRCRVAPTPLFLNLLQERLRRDGPGLNLSRHSRSCIILSSKCGKLKNPDLQHTFNGFDATQDLGRYLAFDIGQGISNRTP